MILINNYQWNPPLQCPLLIPLTHLLHNLVNVHGIAPRPTISTHWQLCLNSFLMKSQWPHIPSSSHWHSMTPLAPNYQRPPPNICHYLQIPKFSDTHPLPLFNLRDVHWSFPVTSLTCTNSKVINEQCPQWLSLTLHRIPLHIHLGLQRLSYWPSNSPNNLIDVHCLPTNSRH